MKIDAKKVLEHLESLSDAVRQFLTYIDCDYDGGLKEHLDMELVRSEDFMEKLKRNG